MSPNRVLGAGHETTLILTDKRAWLLREMGKRDEAEQLMRGRLEAGSSPRDGAGGEVI